MKRLRIGVLGAGLIGRRHIDTILACPEEAELVGVADPVLGSDKFPDVRAPFFTTAEELYDRAKPDSMVIATPNNLHAPQGIDCARRGLHFIVEKPVTDSLESAAALLREVRKAGVKTLTGHHRRYLQAVSTAKKLIAEGALGRLVGISVIWSTRKPEAYFDVAWRKAAGGGPILINLIHEIDLMRHLCGEMVTVSGTVSNAVRGFAVEDGAAAVIAFAGGCIGTVLASDTGLSPWTIEQGTAENPAFAYTGENSYRVVGTEGALELPNLRLWSARDPQAIGWDKPLSATPMKVLERDPYIEQLRHFRRVIHAGEAPLVSAEDGAHTLAATLAVAEAGRTQRLVDLDAARRALA
ncbi:MAG: Gfo/Idh/MocA family oxidoreductase [Alphaproteobacteria bacterium]|nr:Gfo/Idh/MocA family oxidoreductase [Alphaproteobacteria bacterium]